MRRVDRQTQRRQEREKDRRPSLTSALVSTALLGLLALIADPAALHAHSPSNSYLTLTLADHGMDVRWDIALRDLDHVIGLDSDDDGRITWGEVKSQSSAIAAYALARLSVENGGTPCRLRPTDHLIDRHSDGTYAVLRLLAECGGHAGALSGPLRIGYRLFFDLDPQHRGLVQLRSGGTVASTILSPERPDWRLDSGRVDGWRDLWTYFDEGIRHIVFGFDHLLFLVALLLPAVLRSGEGGWQPINSASEAVGEVLKVVTAFTLAHSVTLALATLGWLNLPASIVGPLIALSIIFTAANNVYPMVRRGLWGLAFAFGLVHGIGFADALKDLGLPSGALIVPLFSFNLGVEAGQLAIVAICLPAAFRLRQQRLYRTLGLHFGSIVIAAIAALWFLERAFGVPFLV